MKRIIFSMYTNNIKNKSDGDIGPTDYKKSQFEKFKHNIEASHKKYAKTCRADYNLFTPTGNNYIDIQFEKIIKFEELCNEYDEILYIDFDIIPRTDISFFETENLTECICCHSIKKKLERPVHISHDNRRIMVPFSLESETYESILEVIKLEGHCDPMNMYNKTCAKNAMLLLDGIIGSDLIVNTGVIGTSKKIIEELDFSSRLDECDSVFKEAVIDNIYPNMFSSSWKRNNEIYFSYLVERYKIPLHEIGNKWNFIIDKSVSDITRAAYFVHQINKDFAAALDDYN